MKSKWFTSLLSGIALVGVTLGSALPAPAEQAPDKNGPGVARVSVIEGSAVVQRGDSHTQTNAVRNAPLLPGDYISTGKTSRAEVQFDGMTAVRLGGNVQARITNNDPNNRAMQLADGTAEIGIVRDGRAFQIDTPSATVRASRAGDYRISIAGDGSSWITTRRGSVEVVTPQGTYTLARGRTLVARGAATHPTITYTSEVTFDSFDDFNAQRDSTMLAALNASPNLNPQIAGYDNLDSYGQWQNVAGYGQVWVPQQSSNWAPYRNGSWVWEGGYGWTWVGNEPWGWAPYHYGNWFYANGYGWAWYPPQSYAYPAWQPALVGFFGFSAGGPGWGVSVGFGGGDPCYGGYGGYGGYGYGYGYGCPYGYPYIGWIPIAPFQPFYPYYPGWAWTGFGWGFPGYGFGGYNNVSITRIVNVYNINRYYRNWRYGGGSGTLVGHFHNGTIVGHTIAVNPRTVGRIGAFHGGMPVAPTRSNLGFGRGSLNAPVRLSRAFSSPRFATPHGIVRTPFTAQQRTVARALQTNAVHSDSLTATRGRTVAAPVNRSAMNRTMVNRSVTRQAAPVMRANAPAMRAEAPARENAVPSSWQRFNQARGTELRGMQQDRAAVSAPRSYQSEPRSYQSEQRSYQSAPRSYQNAPRSYQSEQRSYQRSPYESYSRQGAPAYSRESAPSYSRGSYPSYSREAYPSYARPSYSRPSYQSGPSYSHAPPSGGSRPPAGNSGGGGGGRHDSGRRPPQ
ncbi:MAG: FecR domain-containing protein [Candidatus Eremiobacteraeota bacterium]|nr:FecR domain-containing protein [Candidatus Eremiobacteraeota bacterium]